MNTSLTLVPGTANSLSPEEAQLILAFRKFDARDKWATLAIALNKIERRYTSKKSHLTLVSTAKEMNHEN